MADVKQAKVLVVYFSRTGTTQQLAESIARALDADLEGLRETRSRRGAWGWLRSGYEGTYELVAETLPLTHELRDYDLVFVGTPTWNRALSSPVRGFLQHCAGSLKHVALFATCQERGGDTAMAQMEALLSERPLAKLWLREREMRHGPAMWVGEFVDSALTALAVLEKRA
jgi:flavodoxin